MNARSLLRSARLLLPAFTLVSAGACSDGATAPEAPETGPPLITGNVAAGLEAFELECASCHSSQDGFDLKFFAFPDTTIVRRALGHVDLDTAHDIVAYIRTVPGLRAARDFRPFQPGGRRAAGDVGFATDVFGQDGLPADLTAEGLASIDPLDVAIYVDFPLWSFEPANVDWMPDDPLDAGVLDYPTEVGVGRELLEGYHSTHTVDALIGAVLALRIAERDPANPDAPCVLEPFDRFRPVECFETRRWIASLAAQHMFRTGDREAIHPILHDGWWDVGNAARRSRQTGVPIDNAVQNWAQWMYLGWAFEPDRHASVYLSTALDRLGLPRHATFHVLRSMVARGANSRAPFMDVRSAARVAPDHWLYDTIHFGYEHLIDRLDRGVQLRTQEDIDEARRAVSEAWVIAARALGSVQATELAVLRDQVLAGIDAIVTG